MKILAVIKVGVVVLYKQDGQRHRYMGIIGKRVSKIGTYMDEWMLVFEDEAVLWVDLIQKGD